MHSITVTIGRNVGDTPMNDHDWLAFQGEVRHLLLDYREVGDAIEQHNGIGSWAGIAEESAKVTLLRVEPLSESGLTDIREMLRILSRQYRQDAIALTIGTSELIS